MREILQNKESEKIQSKIDLVRTINDGIQKKIDDEWGKLISTNLHTNNKTTIYRYQKQGFSKTAYGPTQAKTWSKIGKTECKVEKYGADYDMIPKWNW